MIVIINEEKIELNPEPVKVYPDYKVHETIGGNTLHIDNNGEAITYTSYMGYTITQMNQLCKSVRDLGDRIEIQKHVGGIYHWFHYHICKKKRRPIAYFESNHGDLTEDQVDLSQYRIGYNVDLGDHVIIQGMYGNKTRVFRKSDNSTIEFKTSTGVKVSEFKSVKQVDTCIKVRIGWWKWYTANLHTQRLI